MRSPRIAFLTIGNAARQGGRAFRDIFSASTPQVVWGTEMPPELREISPTEISLFLDVEEVRLLRRRIENGIVPARTQQMKIRRNKIIPLKSIDSIAAPLDDLRGVCRFECSHYYRRINRAFAKGRKKGGFQSVAEWAATVKENFSQIYDSVKTEGFRSPTPRGETDAEIAQRVTVAEVRKNVFALVDGKHRLVAALALEVGHIPVFVIATVKHGTSSF